MKYMESIPQVGATYNFYDDGKIRPSRRFIATVLRVISCKEAETIKFPICRIGEKSLYDIWKEEKEGHTWLYAEDTDCFIECSITDYDAHTIWFARAKDGGWFSLDIQNSWQSGRLDADGHLTKSLEKILD